MPSLQQIVRTTLGLCLLATAAARAQNASTAQLLAYEPFDSTPGTMDSANGGSGWASAWQVQNNDLTIPGYTITTANPLAYPQLSQSPAYAVGGNAYLSTGRNLDISASSPFTGYMNAGLIGVPSTTLWLSVLLRKDANTDDAISVTLHPNGVAWWTANGQVAFGYFGSASNSAGNRYWSLSLAGTILRSSVPVVVGQTSLLVVRLDFGSRSDVSFFVNPEPGVQDPGTPDVRTSTASNIAFRSLAFYGGDSSGKASIDEIRFAATYDAVVPVLTPPPVPTNVSAVVGDSQATLSWGAITSAATYTIWTHGSASPTATGLTGTSFTLKGLANGSSYSYSVAAVNAVGQSPLSNPITVVPVSGASAGSNGLLASEPFDGPPGPLLNVSSGAGWAAPWTVQNDSSDNPGYTVSSANPLAFAGSPASGQYASGGSAYLASGRFLDTSATGAFSPYVSNDLIGKAGQTIWLGLLIRKDTDSDDANYVVLHAGNKSWYAQTPLVTVGYFGASSNNAGVRYWSLSLNGTVYKTSVPVVVGQTTLLVLRIDFNSTSTAALYVNPASTSVPPGSPNAQATTPDSIGFLALAFYGGDSSGKSSISQIRFSGSYGAAINATSAIPATPTNLLTTAGDGQVSLSWNPVAGATAYQVWMNNAALSQLLATVAGSSYVAKGLTNKAVCSFYVIAVNSVGTSSPTAQVVAIPRSAVSAKAALGTNLSEVSDTSREWPFVDAFKMARPWISQQEGASWGAGGELALTSNGWIASLQPGQYAETIIFDNSLEDAAAHYPSGQYTLLYDGQGTIEFDLNSATISSETPGRMVVAVPTGQTGGVYLKITQTDTADPIRNIRFIMPGFESSYQTQPFHPLFLARLQNYRALRYMEWMRTNDLTIQTWQDRPTLSDYTYVWRGVPLELLIQLANTLHASPWFNMPHQADDDFVSNFAALTKQSLDPDLQAYIEYSNETWNNEFPQSSFVQSQGLHLGLNQDPVLAGAQYASLRSVQMFSLWEKAFGGTNQLVRVLAGQAANSWIGQQMLAYQNAFAYTDALAIAPYYSACSDAATGGWGFLGDPSTEASVTKLTVDQVLDIETSHIQNCALNEMQSNSAVAASNGVKLVAYEGGQHLVGINGAENDDALTALFKAANRNARIQQLYDLYLQNWKAAGGDLFLHYSDVGAYTKWGNWGTLETQDGDPATAPKYQALMNFAAHNP